LFRQREGVKARGLDLKISEEVLDFVGQKGYDPKYGARQIQRAIRELIIIPMGIHLNNFSYDEKLEVYLTMKAGKIDINIETDPLKFDLLMEELTRNEFADHAGALRRSIRMLQEGNFFVQLTSELEMMEQKRRKIGDKKFWKSKKGQKYSYYLATKDKVEMMALQIEGFEEELMMVGMGLQSYNTRIIDDIKAWEKSYFDIKVELFTRINQQSDSCRLAIYGKDLEQVVDIYFDIFKKKEFLVAASSLWFRESHFNEVVESIEKVKDDSGKTVATITKNKPRHEYISKAFDIENKAHSLTPEKESDVFVGIEIDLFGQCPYLYFSEENGFHRLKLEEKKQNTYHIICSEDIKAKITPLDIHRKKHFERKNARRTFSESHIKDNIYKINREITRDNLAEMLITAMNERFNDKLDSVLV
ncbi:MAG: hypothetical protein ACPG19_15335, partial [Saprospiraceae bacterium]